MRSILLILLVSLTVHATDYSNAGKQRNDFGCYGDGVVFGGLPVVGEWRLCYAKPYSLNKDGFNDAAGEVYAASEDGNTLGIYSSSIDHEFKILSHGNEGCFLVEQSVSYDNIGLILNYECTACKVSPGQKTFGQKSAGIDITVGSE